MTVPSVCGKSLTPEKSTCVGNMWQLMTALFISVHSHPLAVKDTEVWRQCRMCSDDCFSTVAHFQAANVHTKAACFLRQPLGIWLRHHLEPVLLL